MSILVYAENWDGKFKKLSYELVAYATGIAKMLGTTVTALSIGSVSQEELKKLGNYGANRIIEVKDDKLNHLINSAYSSIIAQVAEKEGSQIIILSNNFTGKALRQGYRLN